MEIKFKHNTFGPNENLFKLKIFFLIKKQIIASLYGQRNNLFDLKKNIFNLNKFSFSPKMSCLN